MRERHIRGHRVLLILESLKPRGHVALRGQFHDVIGQRSGIDGNGFAGGFEDGIGLLRDAAGASQKSGDSAEDQSAKLPTTRA